MLYVNSHENFTDTSHLETSHEDDSSYDIPTSGTPFFPTWYGGRLLKNY